MDYEQQLLELTNENEELKRQLENEKAVIEVYLERQKQACEPKLSDYLMVSGAFVGAGTAVYWIGRGAIKLWRLVRP